MKTALIAVMGPTASGKSDAAEALADSLGAELLNADAFQIYRGMDVGTGKSDRRDRYHLLDVRDPNESFGVGEYVAAAMTILEDAYRRGRSVVVVGGTGLYVRALFETYTDMGEAPSHEVRAYVSGLPEEEVVRRVVAADPERAAKLDLRNPARTRRALERILEPRPLAARVLPPFVTRKFAIVPEPDDSRDRIRRRVRAMVQNGWLGEIDSLIAKGYRLDDPGFRAIGYRAMALVIAGEIEIEEAIATTIADTVQYAKRQRAWLRSEPNLTVVGPEVDFVALATEPMEAIQGTE